MGESPGIYRDITDRKRSMQHRTIEESIVERSQAA